MGFIETDQTIQTFFAHGSHSSFGDGIGIRSLIGDIDDLDACRLKQGVE
jgi:hypothetical protein